MMANAYKVQVDAGGNMTESTPGSPTAVPQAAPAPPEPIVKIGGQRTRYDTATGEVTVLSDGLPHRSQEERTSTNPLDTGRSPQGVPLSRTRLDETSIISHPKLGGEVRIKEALDFGWLKKTGEGFEWAGEMVSLGAAPVATAEKPADDGEVSLEGVQGTSAVNDIVHGQLRKAAGEVVYAGLVQSYITAADPSAQVAELARRTGQSPEEVRAATDGIYKEYDTAARAVAKANGVRNWDAFVAWVSEKAPDEGLNALHTFVSSHDASRLGRLAKQYSRTGRAEVDYSDEQILAADFGPGVRAIKTEKGVELELRGHGRMSFARAVREGLVRWS